MDSDLVLESVVPGWKRRQGGSFWDVKVRSSIRLGDACSRGRSNSFGTESGEVHGHGAYSSCSSKFEFRDRAPTVANYGEGTVTGDRVE